MVKMRHINIDQERKQSAHVSPAVQGHSDIKYFNGQTESCNGKQNQL